MGEYFVLYDDDDFWYCDFFVKVVEYFDVYFEWQGVVFCIEIVWECEEQGCFVVEECEEFQFQFIVFLFIDIFLFNRFVFIGFFYCCLLYVEIGFYDEKLFVVGDWDFNLKVFFCGVFEYFGDQFLVYWYQCCGVIGSVVNSVVGVCSDYVWYDVSICEEVL